MSQMDWPDQPLVSIITPSYNQGAFIEATIKSILCQDYPHIQYIVMDACSTDKTEKILRKYAPWIDHLVIAKDKGQSDALNRGFQQARGQILAYLNSDDVYTDSTVISKVVKAFQQNTTVDVITGKRIRINAHGSYLSSQPYFKMNLDILEQVCYISQECTFWTREIYDRAGGFVDDSIRFAMDYDLWMRFIKANAQWLMLDEWLGLFRWQENQKTQTQVELICNPEVWHLQTRQGRMPLSFEDAGALNEYLYFGSSPQHTPDAYDYHQVVWKALQQFKCNLFGGHNFEQWTYNVDVTRPVIHPQLLVKSS